MKACKIVHLRQNTGEHNVIIIYFQVCTLLLWKLIVHLIGTELLGMTCFTKETMMNSWILDRSYVVPMIKHFSCFSLWKHLELSQFL